MAEQGTLIRNCLTQGTWTKVSTPTLMASLYPTSHGVREWTERIPSSAVDRSTLVLFTSDHGEEFLEHGRMFHGQSAYGELNRAPLILWQPGRVAAGVVVDETVGTIDLMPTLLELSGLRPAAGMQDRSLVPLLTRKDAGPAAEWTERPTITEKLLSKDEHHDSESYAIVAGGWKLVYNAIRAPGMPEFELYDFANDPLDRHDLSSQHPDVVRKLSAELARWRSKAEAERVKPDSEAARALSSDELERLRALGYVQ